MYLCHRLHVDCPVAEMDDFRVEVLIHLRKLERLDKEPYTSDERADAEEVRDSCCMSVQYVQYILHCFPVSTLCLYVQYILHCFPVAP